MQLVRRKGDRFGAGVQKAKFYAFGVCSPGHDFWESSLQNNARCILPHVDAWCPIIEDNIQTNRIDLEVAIIDGTENHLRRSGT